MKALVRVFANSQPIGYLAESSGRPIITPHAKNAERFDVVNDNRFRTLTDTLVATESRKLPSDRRTFYFQCVATNQAAIVVVGVQSSNLAISSPAIRDDFKSQFVPKMTPNRPFRFFVDRPNRNNNGRA